MSEAEPSRWAHGVVDKLEATQQYSQIFVSNEQLAAAVATTKQTSNASSHVSIDQYARLGLVAAPWAQAYRVPMARVENEAGQWVAPSNDGVLKTLDESTIGADNIVDVNFRAVDPAAYPLVSVLYAAVPTTLSAQFTAEDAQAVRTMLSYVVSPEAQSLAAAEGYVPLPASLSVRAQEAIAKIGSVDPAASTTTVATTAPVTTEAAAAAPVTARAAPPSGSSGPPSGGSPTPAAASPTTRTTVRPTTPGGAGLPTSPAASSLPFDGTAIDGSETPTEVGLGSTEVAEETPADSFASLFHNTPLSPALPTIGAAGAAAAMTGQGLNLWRVNRRPKP